MSTPATGVQEWRDIPWPQVERDVHTLQRRIYRASLRDDGEVVHRLQRLLLSSWSARSLAVRKVTQDNRGKKTAGIDGIKCLGPDERLALAYTLDLERNPEPTRRVWIPKAGSDELRPLGIPTMTDRALQALVKLALEPEWEAKFEPNSYGFRPGRSAHDAVEAIFKGIKHVPKYVLDADIAKCFDRISHQALLDKLNTFPPLRRAIKAWLKAGVLDGDKLFPTEEGTPQGGVISPLLANIALHGLEEAIINAFPKTRRTAEGRIAWNPIVVRYADDFVVMHRDREVVQQCQAVAQEWLRGMGLELKPSKTRIGHTLLEVEGQIGFDFLGFRVRQYPVGERHTGLNTIGHPLGFKTLVFPSKAKVKRHYQRMAEMVREMRSLPQKALINRLNPVIRGWCNYYRTVASTRAFSKLDNRLFRLLYAWARRRHPGKGRKAVVRKYWRDGWNFATPNGANLHRHGATKHARHVKVQGDRSPFDGDWVYWSSRWGHYPGVPPWIGRLIQRQKGQCARCKLYFRPGESFEVIEVHHRDGDPSNSTAMNLEALHGHCHDEVHRRAATKRVASIHDKDYSPEEPDERESLTSGSEDQPGG
jgi:RNA-directed DNA polymerase